MTRTNIKNLPEGKYFTQIAYSDSYPWVEVQRTEKTVTLALVLTAPDPDWKAKMIAVPGSFCGHVMNQAEQTWLFDRIDETNIIVIRLGRSGWTRNGMKFIEDRAVKFCDYNF